MNGKKIIKIISITLLNELGMGFLWGESNSKTLLINVGKAPFEISKTSTTEEGEMLDKDSETSTEEKKDETPLHEVDGASSKKEESETTTEDSEAQVNEDETPTQQVIKRIKKSIEENIAPLNPESSKEDVEKAVENIISELSREVEVLLKKIENNGASTEEKKDETPPKDGETPPPPPPPPSRLQPTQQQQQQQLQLKELNSLKKSIEENIASLSPKSSKEDVEKAVENIISGLSKLVPLEEIDIIEQTIGPSKSPKRERTIKAYIYQAPIKGYGKFKYKYAEKKETMSVPSVNSEQDILEEQEAMERKIEELVKQQKDSEKEIKPTNLQIEEYNKQYEAAKQKYEAAKLQYMQELRDGNLGEMQSISEQIKSNFKEMQRISEEAKKSMYQLRKASEDSKEAKKGIIQCKIAFKELFTTEIARQEQARDEKIISQVVDHIGSAFSKKLKDEKQNIDAYKDVHKMFTKELKLHFTNEASIITTGPGATDTGLKTLFNKFDDSLTNASQTSQNSGQSTKTKDTKTKDTKNDPQEVKEWNLHRCKDGNEWLYSYIDKDRKEFLFNDDSLTRLSPIGKPQGNPLHQLYLKQNAKVASGNLSNSEAHSVRIIMKEVSMSKWQLVKKEP
jgi:hypothetical protein